MENRSLVLEKVNKWYAKEFHAVRDVSLEALPGEFLVFVGPSGCGKSTTLRMIAGLERPDSGAIYMEGELLNRLPPRKRDIAMVFQNYALYPNMSVYENIAFPLKMRGRRVYGYGKKKADIRGSVERMAERLGLTEYLYRRPEALSGGQKQRVALARAMVRAPRLFLMDEPLSNLDAKLRTQMRRELLSLQKSLQTTTIYVTHDQTEAMTMGDRIAVFQDGMLCQIGTPREVYQKPDSLFVARFIGSPPMNIWKEGGHFMGVRPEHIRLTGHPDHIPGRVADVEWTGRETILFVETKGPGRLTVAADARCSLKAGDTCRLTWEKKNCHVFNGKSGKREASMELLP